MFVFNNRILNIPASEITAAGPSFRTEAFTEKTGLFTGTSTYYSDVFCVDIYTIDGDYRFEFDSAADRDECLNKLIEYVTSAVTVTNVPAQTSFAAGVMSTQFSENEPVAPSPSTNAKPKTKPKVTPKTTPAKTKK